MNKIDNIYKLPYNDVKNYIDEIVFVMEMDKSGCLLSDEGFFNKFSEALLYLSVIMLDTKYHTERNRANLSNMLIYFSGFDSSFISKFQNSTSRNVSVIETVLRVNKIKCDAHKDFYMSTKDYLVVNWFIRHGSVIVFYLWILSYYINVIAPMIATLFSHIGILLNVFAMMSYIIIIVNMLWRESSKFSSIIDILRQKNSINYIKYPFYAVTPLDYCVLDYNRFNLTNYLTYYMSLSWLISMCAEQMFEVCSMMAQFNASIESDIRCVTFITYIRNDFCKRICRLVKDEA